MDTTAQIREELDTAIRLRQAALADEALLRRIEALAQTMTQTLKRGGKVIFAGNGGSFADAQHLVAEFVGRFMKERGPLAGLCLGTNSSSVSAIGNDYRFEDIFVRELRAMGRSGDLLVAISTSGNSKNLIEALAAARDMGLTTFSLLGKGGGRMASLAPCIVVPSDHTARIQEMHITIGHIVCGLVDALMESPAPATS